MEQLEGQSIYTMVTTELVCEGGLGWEDFRATIMPIRSLNCTCLQVVRDYLVSCQEFPTWKNLSTFPH
jgi:hypothetical protein